MHDTAAMGSAVPNNCAYGFVSQRVDAVEKPPQMEVAIIAKYAKLKKLPRPAHESLPSPSNPIERAADFTLK
jgi:hypothetical protein